VFPDMPGCFTASDTLEGLLAAAQEAVCTHYGFDNDPLPAASLPDQWLDHPDYQGGFWMIVNVDISRIRQRAVRLNISLPETLVQSIDKEARQRGQSRSAFLASAATKEIDVAAH